MDQKPCGPIAGEACLIQYFKTDASELFGVRLTVATYFKMIRKRLTISLYKINDDIETDAAYTATVAILSTFDPIATVSKSSWSDNENFVLNIDPQTATGICRYALHITADALPGPDLTVWLHSVAGRIPGHMATWYNGQHQGEFGLQATLITASHLALTPVPRAILYSPVTQCNLNCIHCISAETRSSKSVISSRIKDEIRAWCERGLVAKVATDYSGDILWAEKRFGGELSFLESLGVPLHIDTNGVHLDREVSRRLVHSPLQSINISLDAATTETFQRVRKGAPPLEDVVANIAAFMAARSEVDADQRIAVSLSFTLMRSTLDELEAFVRLSASLGIELVHARHLEAYTERMGPESLIFDQQKFREVLPNATAVADSLGVVLASAPLPGTYGRMAHTKCHVAWGSAVIMGNGDVSVCCVPRTTIGNLHQNSMEEIWNGKHYQEFRRRVNSSVPPPQCLACPMMRDWHNVHSYLPFLTMDDWEHPRDWKDIPDP